MSVLKIYFDEALGISNFFHKELVFFPILVYACVLTSKQRYISNLKFFLYQTLEPIFLDLNFFFNQNFCHHILELATLLSVTFTRPKGTADSYILDEPRQNKDQYFTKNDPPFPVPPARN